MELTDILSIVFILVSIPLIVVLARRAKRRAIELDKRIDEYHSEQEAAKDQPGPRDPYADLAALFTDQPKDSGK